MGSPHGRLRYMDIMDTIQLWPWLLVITGYFYGIIHSINGVSSALITGIWGLNCMDKLWFKLMNYIDIMDWLKGKSTGNHGFFPMKYGGFLQKIPSTKPLNKPQIHKFTILIFPIEVARNWQKVYPVFVRWNDPLTTMTPENDRLENDRVIEVKFSQFSGPKYQL